VTHVIDPAGTRFAEKVSCVPAAAGARLPGIDRMRGLVIVLMALDHVRDFFNVDALYFDPTDLTRTYPALFLTRFVTHYCAPTFVLLAGVSAFLHGTKLGDRGALARFLLTRGVWLILIDAIVVSPVWELEFGRIHLGTLWAIGFSMIALAGLVFLPLRAVLLAGALILLSHNLLDPLHAAMFGNWASLWRILHEPGALPFGLPGGVSYPVLPWIGIMALGYGLGPVFLEPATQRARQLTLLGLASLALFLLLRGSNLYGDPRLWSVQRDTVMTVLSVLNVTKYPPSLLYALVTLGPALLLLPAMERASLARCSRHSGGCHFSSICCTFMPRMLRPSRSFSPESLVLTNCVASASKRSRPKGSALVWPAPMPPGSSSWPRFIQPAAGSPM
jgi:uncharacterized membrane protein